MAKVNYCEYCKQSVLNLPYHPECRTEFLESLCAETQATLCNKKVSLILPKSLRTLAEKFRTEHFTTERDSRRAKAEAEDLEHRQASWEIARSEYLQKCEQEWERKHPEPNPPRY